MNDLNIEAPAGYEIDQANSDLSKGIVKFKETSSKVADWGDLRDNISGYYIDTDALIEYSSGDSWHSENKKLFVTAEQATAAKALAMLTQLVKATNGGWEPDWSNEAEAKYTIERRKDSTIYADLWWSSQTTFLVFKTKELRDGFLKEHKGLIQETLPLL